MIGYHYTTQANWLKIEKEGMVPYLINKPELEEFGFYDQMGIWVWQKELSGISEAGSIIFQMQKGSFEVVKLQIEYDYADILKYNSTPVSLSHHGTIGDLIYHNGQQKAYIITAPVPPENVKRLRYYNLLELIK